MIIENLGFSWKWGGLAIGAAFSNTGLELRSSVTLQTGEQPPDLLAFEFASLALKKTWLQIV